MLNQMKLFCKTVAPVQIRNFTRYFPQYDFKYLCNPANVEEIDKNIRLRKGVGNIQNVINLFKQYMSAQILDDSKMINDAEAKLYDELKRIPNMTHPDIIGYGENPKQVKLINEKPVFEGFEPHQFSEIARFLNAFRNNQLGNTMTHKSYFFMNDLAELEEALIKYSVNNLIKKGFQLMSVPDILPAHIIESCGMVATTDRTQIYTLDSTHHGPELCLSGTAEMSLAGLLLDTEHKEKDLPLKLAAVSRCYRAETSNLIEERGIYRVHQFTKVEMFGATTPEQSDEMLQEFLTIEEESFANLGLHMRVLDMPPHELGAPAYRKYDIEAWMPGRKLFGEISSCSNCTDYQARRLGIKYVPNGQTESVFAHTLNGTACAVPRMLIALLETHQKDGGKVEIPKPLQKYMSGKEYLTKRRCTPELKMSKVKPRS